MKSKKELVVWNPLNQELKAIYLDSLKDEQGKLIISFIQENSEQFIQFDFGYHAVFYQKLTHSVALKLLDSYNGELFNSSVFIEKKSKFIDFVVEHSYDIIGENDVMNIVFRHEDGIINVVSSSLPEVQLIGTS